jgi:general secretion pathway protein B
MSYILDALKKSEAEQDPTAAANLASNLELNQQRNQARQRLTGVLVVTALLANVAVLLWLFGPSQLTPAPALSPSARAQEGPPVQAATATPAQKPAESVQAPTTTAAAPRPAQTSPPAARTPAPAAAPVTVAAAPIKARLADLPASIRGRFPGLAFSTHIYAEDPSLRAVVANGRRLLEGDEIGGAAVQRITDNGVVMAFENYLVEIPIVADWE